MAYTPMNEGSYWAHVVDGQCIEVGSKRSPCMAVEMEVTHEAGNGEWIGLRSPVTRTLRLFLTEAAWPYTETKLKTLGFNGDFGNPAFDGDAATDGVELTCRHDHNEGKTYERWDLADFGGGNDVSPPPDDVVRRLNARWKMNQKAQERPGGRPSSPPRSRRSDEAARAAASTAEQEDDIPF